MRPFTEHTGRALPLDRSDVDTDQIVPARYLRRIERTGFGPFLFAEWRKDPDFVLNRPEFAGATILLAGPNFGSGSSREHAVWALEDAGFRTVIAPSSAFWRASRASTVAARLGSCERPVPVVHMSRAARIASRSSSSRSRLRSGAFGSR